MRKRETKGAPTRADPWWVGLVTARMKVLFLAVILSAAHSASAARYLSFLSLGSTYYSVPSGDDTYQRVTTLSFQFGYSYENTVYVSTNGYFSIGTIPTATSLSRFSSSTSYDVVAPFAADIDTRSTGYVRHYLYLRDSSNVNTVSSYIRSELGVSFYGSWMMLAEWRNVPRYGGSTSTTNTFQGVIISDGSNSYAVFLYYCPSMEWSGNAVIGWQVGSSYYRNHPLSGTSNSKQVACLNIATSSYNTVLFKLSSVSSCGSSYVGCFSGGCVYSSSSRCDGDSDCSDGSDEVACSYDTSDSCSSSEFECDNGQCEPNYNRCDGVNDCGDSSDEEGCDDTSDSCGSSEFECDNGQCEPNYNRCDDVNDCGDNSDEVGCVDIGLTIGVSVAIILFLLFLCIPVCIACVAVCVAIKKSCGRPSVTTRVTPMQMTARGPPSTSAPASFPQPMQEYNTAVFKAGPQAAPPPYSGASYPARPPPVPQPTTSSSSASPPAVFSSSYPQPPPYGEQPNKFSHDPAFPPPTCTMAPPPTGSGNTAGNLPQQ